MSGLACVIVSRICSGLENIFCIKNMSCCSSTVPGSKSSQLIYVLVNCKHALQTDWWFLNCSNNSDNWDLDWENDKMSHRMKTDGSNKRLFLFWHSLGIQCNILCRVKVCRDTILMPELMLKAIGCSNHFSCPYKSDHAFTVNDGSKCTFLLSSQNSAKI